MIIIRRAIFVVLLSIGFAACKKQNSTDVFTGTVSVYSCGTAIIDIDGPTGTGSGAKWNDGTKVHSNAATINNYCYLQDKHILSGEKISFRISNTDISGTAPCIVPLCVIARAPASIYIYDAQKAN